MSLDPAAIGLRPASAPSGQSPASGALGTDALGQADFLTLLVAQMRNQDPLNPLSNEDFVAQLAQFSTVSGITEMNGSLGRLLDLSAQGALGAAPQWVGRTVTAEGIPPTLVTGVAAAADGSLTLALADGTALPLSAVRGIA